MYRIIDTRGSGKTSRLMLLAKETGATIVCGNPRAMIEKAQAYGIFGVDFISYHDYIFLDKKINKKYLIDEVELLLNYFPGDIIGYSLTNED